MSYSSLFANILPSIGEGWTSTATPSTNNIGSFFYNLFKFFRNMAQALTGFFTKTITINGEEVSLWLVFGGATIVVVLALVIAKKITPLA